MPVYGENLIKYEYDEYDRVSKIIDNKTSTSEFFTYDGKGNLIEVSNSKGEVIVYDYDNINNLQKTTLDIDGVLRSFDYEYKCEYNDYTPSGYFSRLQRAFPDEVIKGGSGFNGVYGAKAVIKTIQEDSINVDDNSSLSDAVASLSFKEDNSIISYPLSSINKERKAESTTDKTYTYSKWKAEFRNRKTVYGWIKPTNEPTNTQKIFSIASRDAYNFRFTLTANVDKTITLEDLNSDVGDVTFKLTSTKQLIVGKWNLVGFEIDFNYQRKVISAKLIINDEILNGTYTNTLSMDSLEYFIIGDASRYLVSNDYKSQRSSNTENVPVNMPFRLAFVSVGGTNITDMDFKGIYTQGQKYLSNNLEYGSSGVKFFNEDVYKGFDVITLNGSLNSLKRIQPKVHSYTEASFKVEKTRMFKLDNTGSDCTYRHVYASYNSDINLNKGNPSKLAYDLLLEKQGQITCRFKIDDINTYDKRVILHFIKNGIQKMSLFIITNKLYFQHKGSDGYTQIGIVTPNKWHFIGINFNESFTNITFDENVVSTNTSGIDLDGAYTYIGCSVNSLEKPINHLNGCIEMLAFKNSADETNSSINAIRDNGESISIKTYYDDLGRTCSKKIHTKNDILSKTITYAKKDGLTSTKIASETSYDGNDTIKYSYNAFGNVSKVETIKNGNSESKTYEYDGLARLVKSTKNGVTCTYEYDSNNNIFKKNDVYYYYEGTFKDQLTRRSDGTVIYYDETGFIGNPIEIRKPNNQLNLTWLGRRLGSATGGPNSDVVFFRYNANGIRVFKEVVSNYMENYYLDGDKIVTLKRTKGANISSLHFIYDETQSLVGFTYNGEQYFYDRTVNGEIRYIIDKSKTIHVSYEYDDWGVPTISANTEIGQILSDLNPFMYKGYFYDKELGLYYLKTRYYDPDLGRFINADNDVGSVGVTMGMNLYSYCKCNPINYADENGNWPSWATKVCIGLAVIAACGIAAAVCVATGGSACVALSMMVGAAKGALIGAVSGAITGAVTGAITEGIKTGTWEGALKGAVSGAIEGAADGFMWGAIGGAVSGALNSKFCFIGGTLVMTNLGLKAIEEIKIGDKVLAYNDNLEIFEYKEVVEVYENKATKLCHIHTENEEIICTPNHNIFTKDGWKDACELIKNDLIKTANGFAKVLSVEIEELSEEINVYNLNVLCYHTYVVGNGLLVVHNECHHTVSNKGKKGNEIGNKIKDKFPEANLNDRWNKVEIPQHKGRHTDDYHKMIDKCVDKILDKTDDFEEFTQNMKKLGDWVKDNYKCLGKEGKDICEKVIGILIK
ncbi:MAG: RHS repeat-associated core domain-containing protein [Candidatus Caccosoma sp.]|nr:RHS repeat-associated core domain-containing protein [Candidatus Caccosoma sp.]